MIEIRIRPMRLDDLKQVQAIDRLSFSMPWPESAFRFELIENPRSILRVAELSLPAGQSLIVGDIVIWLILDEAHIATLAVHPDYRNRGISKRLLAEALRSTIQKGARSATLEVRAQNTIAHTLYRHFGFEVVGQRPRYYRDNNEDALIMTVKFEKFGERGKRYQEWLESDQWISSGIDLANLASS